MKQILLVVMFLLLSGCGGGGNGNDGSPSSPQISGTYLYDNPSSRVMLTVVSSDNINYTGTLSIYDYRYSPVMFVTGDVKGRIDTEEEPSPHQYQTTDAGNLYSGYVYMDAIKTNIDDFNYDHELFQEFEIVLPPNPNLTVSVPFSFSIRRTLQPDYSFDVSGTMVKQ